MSIVPLASGHVRQPRCRAGASIHPAGLLPVLLLMIGCGGESVRPPALPDRADLYWDLELNHHAVALSMTEPYNKLQLVATPRNYREDPLPGLPTARYVSADPERVVVGDDGVLVAVAPTSEPVVVVATLTADNLNHTDTAWVSVVDDSHPPVLASFSIHPLPPDSAKTAGSAGGNFSLQPPWDTLAARASTAEGERIPIYGRDGAGYLPVHFRVADTMMASFVPVRDAGTRGVLQGKQPGVARIYGSTTAFGRSLADTLEYRIGLPIAAIALIDWATGRVGDGSLTVLQPDIRIAAGGAVAWLFSAPRAADTVDITFAEADLPSVAAMRPAVDRLSALYQIVFFWFCTFDCDSGGSFALTDSERNTGRYFPVPGTYEYHSTRAGFSGRVVVVDER